MYRRVFQVSSDTKTYGIRFKLIWWVTVGVVITGFLSLELAGVFACNPIRRNWDNSVPGTCISTRPRWYTFSAYNFITDVVILAMPMPLINGLTHVTTRQKYALMGVFALGGL